VLLGEVIRQEAASSGQGGQDLRPQAAGCGRCAVLLGRPARRLGSKHCRQARRQAAGCGRCTVLLVLLGEAYATRHQAGGAGARREESTFLAVGRMKAQWAVGIRLGVWGVR
jgi:hypothetical protein